MWGLGPGDYGAGACPLVGGAVSQGLFLESPKGLESNVCTLVCGSQSWALSCAGPCPGTNVGSVALKAARTLGGRTMSVYSCLA